MAGADVNDELEALNKRVAVLEGLLAGLLADALVEIGKLRDDAAYALSEVEDMGYDVRTSRDDIASMDYELGRLTTVTEEAVDKVEVLTGRVDDLRADGIATRSTVSGIEETLFEMQSTLEALQGSARVKARIALGL